MCLAVVAGCGGPVAVPAPELSGQERGVCSRLVESLPERVAGLERREVEPDRGQAAAWGDPPVVLACGVPMPEEFDDFAACQEVDGVGWFIPERQLTGQPEAITMTTIGREVNVRVTLPEEAWPPAPAMADLADVLRREVREVDPCV